MQTFVFCQHLWRKFSSNTTRINWCLPRGPILARFEPAYCLLGNEVGMGENRKEPERIENQPPSLPSPQMIGKSHQRRTRRLRRFFFFFFFFSGFLGAGFTCLPESLAIMRSRLATFLRT